VVSIADGNKWLITRTAADSTNAYVTYLNDQRRFNTCVSQCGRYSPYDSQQAAVQRSYISQVIS